ncbi:MAG: S-layer homology domain-containing protein [Bacillota bacterium]
MFNRGFLFFFTLFLLLFIPLNLTLSPPRAFSAPAYHQPGDQSFGDLENHWAKSAVYRLAALDIFAGYPDGTFRPERPVTQLEAVALIMRTGGFGEIRPTRSTTRSTGAARGAAQGKKSGGAAPEGPKIPAVPWGENHLRLAVEKEFLPPPMLSSFTPDAAITRAEMAAFLGRALQLPVEEAAAGANGFLFTDLEQAPPYCVPYIRAVARAGFMSGYPDGSFRPNQTLRRSEMAVILSHLLDEDWVKVSPGRRLTGWISGIQQTRGRQEIAFTTLEGEQKIRPAPGLKCFLQGESTELFRAVNHRVELILDKRKQARYVNILERRKMRLPSEKITGTVKSVLLGEDSYLQLSDLNCADRTLPLAWDAVVEGKSARQGFLSLRPETFVEAALAGGEVSKVTVLDVKKISGTVESLTGKTLRLAGAGDKTKWPEWFHYWDRARIVDKDGKKAGGIQAGDRVQITYLDPFPDEIEDERVLEIMVQRP